MKPATLETVYQLSPMQSGLLFHALYDPASSVYVNQSVFSVKGELCHAAMASAWQRVVDRHQALRSSFFWEGLEHPVQAVHRQVGFDIECEDWRSVDAAAQAAALATRLAAERRRGFDLRRPVQMRLALLRTGAACHQLVWTRHHILFDGWSQALVLREAFVLYEAFVRVPDGSFDEATLVGPRRALEPWVRWLQGRDRSQAAAFWREHLARATVPTPLGLLPASAGAAPQQQEVAFALAAGVAARLEAAARERRLTLASLVHAAWALLLVFVSGSPCVVFGSTLSGRPPELAGIESMVGLFINTLPLRAAVDPRQRLVDFALGLQSQHLRLAEYQHTPLVEIQRLAGLAPAARLFDSLVVIGNYPLFQAGRQAASLRLGESRNEVENSLPLTLRVTPGALARVALLHDPRALPAEQARTWLDQLVQLLGALPEALDEPLAQLLAMLERRRADESAAALATGAGRLAAVRRQAVHST